MKRFTKILSVILSALICLPVIAAGISPVFADTSFDDGDGAVTIYDAEYIQRFLAKFPDLYHIGYTSALY